MPVVTIVGNPNISVEDKREMVKKVSETRNGKKSK